MFFRPKGQISLHTDIHSHLIPNVDDGVKSIDEAVEIIKEFQAIGYRRLITTPHISEAYYPNSIERLKEGYLALKAELDRQGIAMEVVLGAEYMTDGMLISSLKNKEELLSWNGYLLVETPFHNLPWIFDEIVFELQARKLVPVLAHPERYTYLADDFGKLEQLRNKGIKLQISIGSLAGQYGVTPKKMAKKIIASGWADFLGSDVHRMEHMETLKKGLTSRTLLKHKVNGFLNDLLN
jgi:tyrosine-protein phosphatase YwqE